MVVPGRASTTLGTVQYNKVQYSTVQYNTAQCSKDLRHGAELDRPPRPLDGEPDLGVGHMQRQVARVLGDENGESENDSKNMKEKRKKYLNEK